MLMTLFRLRKAVGRLLALTVAPLAAVGIMALPIQLTDDEDQPTFRIAKAHADDDGADDEDGGDGSDDEDFDDEDSEDEDSADEDSADEDSEDDDSEDDNSEDETV